MKKALLSISLFSLSLLASGQVLLNQATGMVTGGIASQDFETAYNIYDCAAADDFIVPSGVTWTIDSIRIYGQYSASAQTVSSARLTLYLDSGGMPAAEVGTYTWSTDQDVNADGDLLLVFDCPVKLGPQRYWMSVQSTKTFANGGGQWYWTRDSIGGGLPFFWHNVGGGFGNPGVHNLLEPATFGVPIVIGPNYSHFAEATALVNMEGCISISNQNELNDTFSNLISNKDIRHEKGHICSTFVQMNKGATGSILKFIQNDNF